MKLRGYGALEDPLPEGEEMEDARKKVSNEHYTQDAPEDNSSSSYLRKQVSMPWIPASAEMTTGWDIQLCNFLTYFPKSTFYQ